MREIKLIVAGGRDFDDYDRVAKAIRDYAEQVPDDCAVSIVSGMARGADAIAHKFCKINGVVCYEFPANWDKYGKSAGFRRNTEMAQFADVLVAFWDGESRGTAHMIETMQRLNKPVHIVRY